MYTGCMLTDDELSSRWAASLRTARLAAQLSQSQLAERAGLTKSAISRLELAGGLPNNQTRQALATALGMRVEDLFSYADTTSAAAS